MTQQIENPECELRAGAICAAIWRKEVQHNRRRWVEYSIRIQKRYKDERSGEWKTTTYFRAEDMPKLALVANQVYAYVTLREVTGAEIREGGS